MKVRSECRKGGSFRKPCIVQNCENHGNHKFPTDKTRKAEWLRIIKHKRLGWKLTKFLYICSAHFKPSDYVDWINVHGQQPVYLEGHHRKFLKRCAVPSVFPWGETPLASETEIPKAKYTYSRKPPIAFVEIPLLAQPIKTETDLLDNEGISLVELPPLAQSIKTEMDSSDNEIMSFVEVPPLAQQIKTEIDTPDNGGISLVEVPPLAQTIKTEMPDNEIITFVGVPSLAQSIKTEMDSRDSERMSLIEVPPLAQPIKKEMPDNERISFVEVPPLAQPIKTELDLTYNGNGLQPNPDMFENVTSIKRKVLRRN